MITDVILLAFSFGLFYGLSKLIAKHHSSSYAQKAASYPSHSKSSAAASNASTTKLGSSGTTIDWSTGEMKLKTNLRPVTQQDLLERAEQSGQDSGRFVAKHADSFHFGAKQK